MTDVELQEAKNLVGEIGLRAAARQLNMSHTTLMRRLKKLEQPKAAPSDQTPTEQLVDAIERYARWIYNRPPMPASNSNWSRNCDWIAKHISLHLDSWKLRNDD